MLLVPRTTFWRAMKAGGFEVEGKGFDIMVGENLCIVERV